jgi:DNA-binding MarR family transcriptional regulator
MAKYDDAFNETMKGYNSPRMASKDIISKYELTDKEIQVMRYLYRKQYDKKDIIENFNYVWDDINSADISKILGSLKKKGLIYSVNDMPGYLGTEIMI